MLKDFVVENQTLAMWLEFAIVLICIFFGARMGGVGLGVMGGVGVAIFTFIFGINPVKDAVNNPFGHIPLDVLIIILAVIIAAATLEASGGMNYLIHIAEKMLRKNPKMITFVAPLVTYLFTFLAGTGHVAYALLPVISEVSREAGVRPERPLSIAVIASQQAITASPISAATAAMLTILTDITLTDILLICIPSTLIGVMTAAFVVSKMGKELPDDPEYLKRMEEGLAPLQKAKQAYKPTPGAKLSVWLFLLGAFAVVILGRISELRPSFEKVETKIDAATSVATITKTIEPLSMPMTIILVMLIVSALMIIFCRTNVAKIASGEVFKAGMIAVVAIMGIAWMGNLFFAANKTFIESNLKNIVNDHTWLFAVALFILSVLVYSQGAATKTLMPVGASLGLSSGLLVGMFPAVNGYFFFPNYPTVVAAINFDRTGTTRVGKYMLNHSFMIPGLVSTIIAVAIGMIIGPMIIN